MSKFRIFCDRSFTWFLNYFSAKFLEIWTTGSSEIGKFLQKRSVSIFRATAHALHLAGFFQYGKFWELLSSLHRYFFVAYLCYKRLKPSTHSIQIRRKIEKVELLGKCSGQQTPSTRKNLFQKTCELSRPVNQVWKYPKYPVI